MDRNLKVQNHAGCEQHAKIETENRRRKLMHLQSQHVILVRVYFLCAHFRAAAEMHLYFRKQAQ